ncbi:MAG TPA: methyltransferase domain-containing protein [Acidimicrobiales bacterium]
MATATRPAQAHLVDAAGGRVPLDIDRWRRDLDHVEHALLGDLPDPVLDVGCGPGRVPAALAAAGRTTLGIDLSPHAVAEARGRGAPVLHRSVFGRLPGEARWGAVVLLDGNIGIGGDPLALLRRVGELLAPGGRLLAEVEAPGASTGCLAVRIETAAGRAVGPWFPWARVGADRFGSLAEAAGLESRGVVQAGERWFGLAARRDAGPDVHRVLEGS